MMIKHNSNYSKNSNFVVFIPIHNISKLLFNTLDSLYYNDIIGEKLEVIILTKEKLDKRYIQQYLDKINIIIIKSHDSGLYDALGKHLPQVKSKFVTWLGAGDMWHKNANQNAHDLAKRGYNWYSGRPNFFDKSGQINTILPLNNYLNRLIVEGRYNGALPLIQQEAVLWHSNLHESVDWEYFRRLKYAGDYFLWKSFAAIEHIKSSNVLIGGYRLHDNSLSSMYFHEYLSEIKNFTRKSFWGEAIFLYEKSKLLFSKVAGNRGKLETLA